MCAETRVAVVTGGGRGIGRGITMSLADQGFALVINYRSDEEAAIEACREAEKRGSPQRNRDPRRRRRPRAGASTPGRNDPGSWPSRPLGQQCRRRPRAAVGSVGNHTRELGPCPGDQSSRTVLPDPGRRPKAMIELIAAGIDR